MRLLLYSLLLALLMACPVHSQNLSSTLYPKTPACFRENAGQIIDQHGAPRKDIRYLYSAPGLKVYFRTNGFSYELSTVERGSQKRSEATGQASATAQEREEPVVHTHRIDVSLPGASAAVQIEPTLPAGDDHMYYLAHTPEEGVKARAYSILTYKNAWPGGWGKRRLTKPGHAHGRALLFL